MHTFEWLARLISIDTTSRYSNLRLIELVQDWFARHQVPYRMTHDATNEKANLFATLPAFDGSLSGGIVLSGHTDVVPVDNQAWETNPFEAEEINDRIYGRGTSDMKGFLAVALALLPEFQKYNLKHPIHFALSYDEEIGCLGAPLLISDLKKAKIKPSACIVGEPTEMKPVVAHKGIQVFRCQVHGLAAHSSLTPEGCNAIEYAASWITFLRALAKEMQQDGPFDPDFDVPFTTLSTNMIHGGIAQNTIPSLCEFIFEFRHLPKVKPDVISKKIDTFVVKELLPAMQKEFIGAALQLNTIASVPSFESDNKSAIAKLVKSICGDKKTHKVAYATEAGLFQQAEIPTIVCGPGSIEQAHRPNEYIAISELKKCEEFLRQVVEDYCC